MAQNITFKSFNKIDEFQGTAKHFEDSFIALNGAVLNQVSVNALARHGLLEVVGEGEKPSRGRTPKLYRAVSKKGFIVQKAEAVITEVKEVKQEETEVQTQENTEVALNTETPAIAQVEVDGPF